MKIANKLLLAIALSLEKPVLGFNLIKFQNGQLLIRIKRDYLPWEDFFVSDNAHLESHLYWVQTFINERFPVFEAFYKGLIDFQIHKCSILENLFIELINEFLEERRIYVEERPLIFKSIVPEISPITERLIFFSEISNLSLAEMIFLLNVDELADLGLPMVLSLEAKFGKSNEHIKLSDWEYLAPKRAHYISNGLKICKLIEHLQDPNISTYMDDNEAFMWELLLCPHPEIREIKSLGIMKNQIARRTLFSVLMTDKPDPYKMFFKLENLKNADKRNGAEFISLVERSTLAGHGSSSELILMAMYISSLAPNISDLATVLPADVFTLMTKGWRADFLNDMNAKYPDFESEILSKFLVAFQYLFESFSYFDWDDFFDQLAIMYCDPTAKIASGKLNIYATVMKRRREQSILAVYQYISKLKIFNNQVPPRDDLEFVAAVINVAKDTNQIDGLVYLVLKRVYIDESLLMIPFDPFEVIVSYEDPKEWVDDIIEKLLQEKVSRNDEVEVRRIILDHLGAQDHNSAPFDIIGDKAISIKNIIRGARDCGPYNKLRDSTVDEDGNDSDSDHGSDEFFEPAENPYALLEGRSEDEC